MLLAIAGLSAIVGLISLVCWIYTVVVAFTNETAVIGIVCLCPLVALIMGLVKMKEWNHEKVMMIWGACIGVNILLQVVVGALSVGAGGV